ncbi:type IV secretion protein Rhs [Burkholderia pseudomallei]|uniref:RHS repeat-associated core domain-containing protein n=1 Tax=Burkholderia pseudomallei TaxID=28450 RepID=UPI001AAEA9F8|nr:RHS repeat-associated core domain-containing protein [Burkholderia pseudomallei]MBO3031197.1 type IV secretion protein Rhs [Burkholderia pseudomallei]MBO7846250.1 type IV secretion protein Rhs [Burkholderia pseudomallei]
MAAAEWGGGVALPAVKHLDPVVGIDVHSVLVTPGTPPVFLPHPYVGFMLDRREYIDAALGVIGSIVFTFTPLGKEAEAGLKWAKKQAKAELMSDPLIAEGVKLGKEAAPVAGDIAGAVGAGVGMGSMMGRPIFVNGFLRATAGTHSFHVPGLHFPLGESFAPPPEDFEPSNDGESYMGSRTVLANNDPMSFMALPAMSCWSVGLEPPPHNGAHTQRTALSMPSSVMLPIPVGRPVLVGGPPVMNMAALASSLFKAFRGSDWAKALADKLHLKPGFLRCNVLRAEPVDAITGEVVVQQHDFTVPGRLPLVWNRYYTSHDTYVGAVGIGWQTPADIRLELTRHEGAVGVVAYFPDHATAFDAIPDAAGWPARVYDWQHGQALYRQDDRLVLRTRAGFEYEFALPAHWQHALERLAEDATLTLPVERMADLNGNAWVFERGLDSSLTRLVEWKAEEATGRMIACAASASSRAGDHVSLLTALTLIDAGGRAHPLVSYQHDRNVDLVAAIDAMGQPHRYAYTDGHRMVRHTSARGVSFYYSHRQHDDGVWRVDHAWGDNGLADYRFIYDVGHRETQITDSLGHVTILQANERGLPVARIDPLGAVTSYRYDAQGRTNAQTDPAGRTITWRYDAYGNLLMQTLPDRSVVRAEYNADHKPICLTVPGDRQWRYAWDKRGNLVAQTTPTQASMRYGYDRHGQLVAHMGPRGAVTRFDYDHDGNLSAVVDALGHLTRYTHDARANLIHTVNALGQVRRYEYDRNGNLTRAIEPGGREIFCRYDSSGNLTRYRDPNGQVTQLEYSPLRQIAKRLTPDGGVVEYRYDTEERLIGVVNERGELYQLKRDALGRIVEEIDYWGQSRRYQYGAAGELLRSVDPLGQAIDYETDVLGRIVKKRVPDPRQPGGIRTETFSYDRSGNLIVAENPDSRVELAYDAAGRVVEERQGDDFVIAHAYDAAGNRIERRTRLNAGGEVIAHTVRYDYNALGAVSSIQIDDAAPITFERDALGQIRVEHLRAELRRELSYTLDGLLAKQTLLAGTGVLFASEYAYDANGEMLGKRDSRFGIEGYQYDPMGRLTGHLDPTGKLREFSYDSAGDLLKTHFRCGRLTEIVNQGTEARDWIRDGEYDGRYWAYDQLGNLVRKRELQQDLVLQWDAQGLLIESLIVRSPSADPESGGDVPDVRTHYAYDAFHRRTRKIAHVVRDAGTQTAAKSDATVLRRVSRFFWDGDALAGELAEIDGAQRVAAGNWEHREWIYYPDTFVPLVSVIDAGTSCDLSRNRHGCRIFYYRYDANGRPTQMTDSSGREVWATGYDENGRLVPINADIYNPIHLQGQYRDAETGLHYNRHRYYDPALGSFISKDPLGLAAGVNLYRYAPNSIGWADPLGFQAKPSPNNNLPWDFRHIFGELDLNRNPPLRGFHINRPGRQIINYWSTFPNGRYLARVIPLGGPCVHGAYQGDVQIDGDNGWQTVANNKSFFPDNWNGAELRRQLQSIDTNDPSQWFFDSGTRKFEATTPSGLRIAGFFDRNEGAYRPFPECC